MTLKFLLKTFTITSFMLAFSLSALAESAFDVRLDGDISGEYNSNLAQVKDFPGDFVNSYTGGLTARYTFPSQTQIISRLQGQYSKFLYKSDFDRVMFAGAVNISQWFFDSMNVYVGAQPIKLFSLSNNRQPLDMLYLGGATYYLPIMSNDLSYLGYQFDRLQAEAKDFSSYNHTVFLGLRHPFSESLVAYLGGRFKLRNLDNAQVDKQFAGNVSLQYAFNDWLSIQASGNYTYITSSVNERNVGVYSTGINLVSGLNNTFKF